MRRLFSIALLALSATAGSAGASAQGDAARAEAAAAVEALRADLDAILKGPALARTRVGAAVFLPSRPTPLFVHAAGAALAPASNMKVLTSVAALGLLGPDLRLETELVSTAAPGNDGALDAPLWIKGSGDPSLVGESWWLMARELRLAGVRSIAGGLRADTSLFDGPSRPSGWPAPSCDRPYCAPFDALMANFSSVEIRVRPADRAGGRASVELFPLECGLAVENHARTIPGAASNVRVSLEAGGEVGRVMVRGSLGQGSREVRTYRRVPEPAIYALACLRDALGREGIDVRGDLAVADAPATARVLVRHRSRPLYDVISDMNKYSNNVMAESLVKLLGTLEGQPGATLAGLARVQEYLEEKGVATNGWKLADGSGLSADGRISAVGLAGTLVVAYRDPLLGPELVTSLAVGGDVGTLSDRLVGSGRRVRAKTGTIKGVISLAGFAYPEVGGEPLAFAFLVNGPGADTAGARDALDGAALRLLDVKLPASARR